MRILYLWISPDFKKEEIYIVRKDIYSTQQNIVIIYMFYFGIYII